MITSSLWLLIQNTPLIERHRFKDDIVQCKTILVRDRDHSDVGDGVFFVEVYFVVGFLPEALFVVKGGGDDQLVTVDEVAMDA